MTKLNDGQKIVRELEKVLDSAGRPMVVTLTADGITYKSKGCKTVTAQVSHPVIIAQNRGKE